MRACVRVRLHSGVRQSARFSEKRHKGCNAVVFLRSSLLRHQCLVCHGPHLSGHGFARVACSGSRGKYSYSHGVARAEIDGGSFGKPDAPRLGWCGPGRPERNFLTLFRRSVKKPEYATRRLPGSCSMSPRERESNGETDRETETETKV